MTMKAAISQDKPAKATVRSIGNHASRGSAFRLPEDRNPTNTKLLTSIVLNLEKIVILLFYCDSTAITPTSVYRPALKSARAATTKAINGSVSSG